MNETRRNEFINYCNGVPIERLDQMVRGLYKDTYSLTYSGPQSTNYRSKQASVGYSDAPERYEIAKQVLLERRPLVVSEKKTTIKIPAGVRTQRHHTAKKHTASAFAAKKTPSKDEMNFKPDGVAARLWW
jgi:hypothetical protein